MSGREYLGCLGVLALLMLLGGAGIGTVATFVLSKVGGALLLLVIGAAFFWFVLRDEPPDPGPGGGP